MSHLALLMPFGLGKKKEKPVVDGTVTRLEVRLQQQGWERGYNFILEKIDENGNPILRVPVYMHGAEFMGTINEGDRVSITLDEELKQGQMIETDVLFNNHYNGEFIVTKDGGQHWTKAAKERKLNK